MCILNFDGLARGDCVGNPSSEIVTGVANQHARGNERMIGLDAGKGDSLRILPLGIETIEGRKLDVVRVLAKDVGNTLPRFGLGRRIAAAGGEVAQGAQTALADYVVGRLGNGGEDAT